MDLPPAEDTEKRGAPFAGTGETLRQHFYQLAETWRRETQHSSRISTKSMHPAYLEIIEMGWPVVPLILEALEKQPAHWFVALVAITHLDVGKEGDNFLSARDAWLEWGRGCFLLPKTANAEPGAQEHPPDGKAK